MKILIATFLLFFSLYANTNNSFIDKCIKITDKKDFNTTKAIDICKKAYKSDSNNIKVTHSLVRSYYSEKDYNSALFYINKGIVLNDSRSQLYLGAMYFNGTGVKKDYKKAYEWFLKSAKQGDSNSQLYLGNMYFYGNGVKKDYKKAYKWYLKSAKQGNSDAQFALGYMYYNGKGVKKDYKKAYKWYLKSAKQGNSDAQFRLGITYDLGSGIKKDYKKAYKWYLKSAKQGNSDAQIALSYMYFNGTGVKKDYKKAYKWLLKSAKQGNSDAQFKLGGAYYYGDWVKKDYKKAYEWFLKSAKQGNSVAQIALGYMYCNGKGVKKDYILAYAWTNLALSNSDSKNARELLNDLEQKMTNEQIANAQSIDPLKILNKQNTDKSNTTKSTATAFFINFNNLVTNYHAIKNCNKIDISNKYYKSNAIVKYTDPINDLAILETKNKNSSYIYLREGSYIKAGEEIVALGYPLSNILGNNIKLTLGIVSSLSGISNDITNIQHTAPIQAGNSGGTLLDHSGNLVGVVVARLQKEQNVNFAIKSTILEMFLNTNSIKYYKRTSNNNISIPNIAEENNKAIVQLKCKD